MKTIYLLFYIFCPIIFLFIDVILTKICKNQKLRFYILICTFTLILSLWCGLRSINTGNDTSAYYDNYISIKSLSVSEMFKTYSHFDKGYLLFAYLFSKLGLPFQFFNFICSVIFILPAILLSFKLSHYPTLSVIVYFTFGMFTLNMSGLRQSLAIGLCLWSLFIIFSMKSNWKYVVSLPFVLISIFFHKSAAAFLLIYVLLLVPLEYKKISKPFLIFTLIICVFSPYLLFIWYYSTTNFFEIQSFDAPNLNIFISGSLILISTLFILFMLKKYKNLPSASFIESLKFQKIASLNKNIEISNKVNVDDSTRLIVASFIFYLLFTICEFSIKVFSRFNYYSLFFICLLLPNYLFDLKVKNKNILIFICFVLLCIGYMYVTTLQSNYLGVLTL